LASVLSVSFAQVQRSTIDFSQAVQDPQTGQLCVMQQVCIADIEALSRWELLYKKLFCELFLFRSRFIF
jgi:hypothetical protein